MFPIKINKIDGEPHPEGVHRFAGNDPETIPVVQAFPAKQALAAIPAISGDLDAVPEVRLAG
jgi:hypothetical protein